MLTGNNGILTRTGEARDLTGEKQIIEEAQLDILAQQASKLSEDLTEAELEGILSPKYGTLSTEEKRTIDKKLTTTDGKYVIPVLKIYNGTLSILKPGETAVATETDNYVDSSRKTATVPAGFTVSSETGTTEGKTNETLIDNGLVIKKGSDEYVWIPVPRTIFNKSEIESTDGEGNVILDYDKIYVALNSYASLYREGKAGQGCYWKDEWYDKNNKKATDSGADLTNTEGCGLTSENYTKQYQRMLKSVYTNGGFWIGRYEASSGSTAPLSQKEKTPQVNITCSDAQIQAAKVATSDTTNNANSVNYTSSLMFGIQWDLVCKFLEGSSEWKITESTPASWYINTDSSSWGVYSKSSKSNTGSSTDPVTKRRNIYDFAGNVYEWTLEHATSISDFPCSIRGGSYNLTGSGMPVSYRGINFTTGSFVSVRFSCSTLLVDLSTDSDKL